MIAAAAFSFLVSATPFEDASGITLSKASDDLVIQQIAEGSAADASGLLASDVLVHIDGKAVQGLDAEKLSEFVQKKGGTVHHVVVKREGKNRLQTLRLKAPLST